MPKRDCSSASTTRRVLCGTTTNAWADSGRRGNRAGPVKAVGAGSGLFKVAVSSGRCARAASCTCRSVELLLKNSTQRPARGGNEGRHLDGAGVVGRDQAPVRQ